MDVPSLRELEAIPSRSHLLFNGEGSCMLVVKLLGRAVHLQVPCVQPNQVPLGILLPWVLPHIIALLHCHCSLLHPLLSCSLGFCELSHPLFSCWVHFRGWSNSTIPWMSSVFKEERCLSSC